MSNQLPGDVVYVRTTNTFDNDTVPAGLLRAHQVADNVWGRLVVHSGTVGFVFEDAPDEPQVINAGGSIVIPPQRHHHVVLDGPATFAVEFFRRPETTRVALGRESTGLTDHHD